MRFRMGGLIATAVLALLIVGCDEANENMTANHNANANAAAANANAPAANSNTTANENTNTRRGPTREDYDRDKDRYIREAKEAGRTIGTGINDGWLWTKTRFELATADDLRDSTINVDVDKEVVTLTGTVATPAQKAKAETIAKSIEGVKSVKNSLKVVADNSNSAKATK